MAADSIELHTYRVLMPDGGGWRDLVSFLSPDSVFGSGLPAEAIIGSLRNHLSGPEDEPGELSPQNFAVNVVFREFLHDVVRRVAPEQAGLNAEARRVGNGFVYVVDPRTPDPGGEMPAEDYLGAFEVREGVVLGDTYQANPEFRVFGQNGFVTLSGWIGQRLIEELVRRHGRA